MPHEIILIDSNNLAYRVHYSNRYLMTSRGKPSSVLHGFFMTLCRLRTDYPESDFVFLWDRGLSWRKRYVASRMRAIKETNGDVALLVGTAYKQNRSDDEERKIIQQQLPDAREMIHALGFSQLGVQSFEADDLIAFAAREIFLDLPVAVFSNDADFYQLINDKVSILKPERGGEISRIDQARLKEMHGLYPDQWAKMRAIAGDKSDNLKPIPGVAEVTASRMVRAGVNPAAADAPDGLARQFPKVLAYWQAVHLCYQLSVLPNRSLLEPDEITRLNDGLEKLAALGYKKRISANGRIYDICQDYELTRFLAEFRLLW